jgi:hypothetical protein
MSAKALGQPRPQRLNNIDKPAAPATTEGSHYMRKVLFAALAAVSVSAAGATFEVFRDYTPSTEVWNVVFVRVNPNRLDDYLEGLKQTWWSGCEVGKKQGTVLDCSIFASDTMANRDFNVLLVIKAPNAAVSDPNEKRYAEFMALTRKMLAEEKQRKLVEGYEELRTFYGEQNFRKLSFK